MANKLIIKGRLHSPRLCEIKKRLQVTYVMSEEFDHPWFSMVVEYKNCLDHLKIRNKGIKVDNLFSLSIMSVQDGRHCVSHNPLV